MPDVAPEISEKVTPPSVETCHWTVGAGLPVAAAVKDTGRPRLTRASAGWVVTTGTVSTDRVAAVDVADPTELVSTASYWFPSSAAVVTTDRVAELAPGIGVNVDPPSVDTSHWTCGVGLPVPPVVKVAVWPATTVVAVGWVVTAGEVPTKPKNESETAPAPDVVAKVGVEPLVDQDEPPPPPPPAPQSTPAVAVLPRPPT